MNATQHHVVLGATGVVGRETVSALTAANVAVTAVSRSGSPVGGAEARAADLRDGGAVAGVLDGASVAYLTVGLPYTLKAWRADWPTVVRNTIDGCVASGAHLVYFDNVYAYGRADQPMTEATPIRPASRKGELRASLLEMLDEAARERGLVVTVGRSADFYVAYMIEEYAARELRIIGEMKAARERVANGEGIPHEEAMQRLKATINRARRPAAE